jgi:hypothetical protein
MVLVYLVPTMIRQQSPKYHITPDIFLISYKTEEAIDLHRKRASQSPNRADIVNA